MEALEQELVTLMRGVANWEVAPSKATQIREDLKKRYPYQGMLFQTPQGNLGWALHVKGAESPKLVNGERVVGAVEFDWSFWAQGFAWFYQGKYGRTASAKTLDELVQHVLEIDC